MDETRRQRFLDFVDWTRAHVTGDEKGQAQIFLDRLFKAFARPGLLEVGGKPEFRVRKSADDGGGTAFADFVWKPIVLIEMKKRGQDLARHFRQAFDYWVRLAPGRPRYVVLCNFDEFWVYDFEEEVDEPKDKLTLDELPERWGPLAFLFPTAESPKFKIDRLAVTRAAADRLATCYSKLAARKNIGPETAQRFILQMLIALFSEDIGLLPKYFVADLLKDCTDPGKSFDLLGGLFTAMATPGGVRGGRYKEVPYFNGGIFAQPSPVELYDDELNQLKRALEYDWSLISPDIFGTIFQHSMDEAERHRYGGHYTAPIDIMKIVGPTIVQPWRTLIEEARSIDRLTALRQRLYTFRVLDPACGSGNFLYIAYRELKRIEKRLVERMAEIAPSRRGERQFGFLSSKQFYGIDIIPFAVELAKVTMTLAHKLAIDELHIDEPALPLDNLDANIRCADALIEFTPSRDREGAIPGPAPDEPLPDGRGSERPLPTPWPRADVIIGNPPFLGAKRLKPERGAKYVNIVRELYPEVSGMADYCVYWLRRAHDHLPVCRAEDPVAGRAGLVGTQNIRNNQSRVGGLDYIVQSGTIVEAVDNQPWSGEANVHVSIVNWVKHPSETTDLNPMLVPDQKKLWSKTEFTEPLFSNGVSNHLRTEVTGKRGQTLRSKSYELAHRECAKINSALSDQADLSVARALRCNQEPQVCFQGVVPGYDGFVIELSERAKMIRASKADATVVRPFLIGRDLLSGDAQPSRAIIDFDDLDLLAASCYAIPFAHVQRHVLPAVRRKAKEATGTDMAEARKQHLDRWWQFWNVRMGLRKAVRRMKRFAVCSRVTKRPVFAFLSRGVYPDNTVMVFALADDYSFGILQSNVHWQWFVAKCSKLKSDFRYTPETVFDTFPWPQGRRFRGPTKRQIKAVAAAACKLRKLRTTALAKTSGGLRALYRTLELPGQSSLREAHAVLDAAVLNAYSFDPDADLLSQLLKLNLEVAARLDRGEAVTAPGVPPSYGDPTALITRDCIRP